MTSAKIKEILEDNGYDVDDIPKTGSILAGKNGCAAIVAMESGQSVTCWVFQVGKNKMTNVYDAIKFSKGGIIS